MSPYVGRGGQHHHLSGTHQLISAAQRPEVLLKRDAIDDGVTAQYVAENGTAFVVSKLADANPNTQRQGEE